MAFVHVRSRQPNFSAAAFHGREPHGRVGVAEEHNRGARGRVAEDAGSAARVGVAVEASVDEDGRLVGIGIGQAGLQVGRHVLDGEGPRDLGVDGSRLLVEL